MLYVCMENHLVIYIYKSGRRAITNGPTQLTSYQTSHGVTRECPGNAPFVIS